MPPKVTELITTWWSVKAYYKICGWLHSPAAIAPASATAPATKLATRFPGATTANSNCDTFPIPETGLRSVSPRARIANTATSNENKTAKAGCHGGIANMGVNIPVHTSEATTRPGSHILHEIC